MLYLTGDMVIRDRQAIFLSGPKDQCVNLTIRCQITTTNFRHTKINMLGSHLQHNYFIYSPLLTTQALPYMQFTKCLSNSKLNF